MSFRVENFIYRDLEMVKVTRLEYVERGMLGDACMLFVQGFSGHSLIQKIKALYPQANEATVVRATGAIVGLLIDKKAIAHIKPGHCYLDILPLDNTSVALEVTYG